MFYQLVCEKCVQLIKLRASGNSVCVLSSVKYYRLQWGKKVENKKLSMLSSERISELRFLQLNLIDVQLEI